MWWGPAILCILVSIALLVLDVFAYLRRQSWFDFLQNDDKSWIINPGAFSLWIFLLSMAVVVPSVRFAVKRLVLNHRPPEQIKLDTY
jgi:hypothetical protein